MKPEYLLHLFYYFAIIHRYNKLLTLFKSHSMKKKIGILGSTGSIGENTLNVVREFDQKFEVVFLTANSNVEKIYRQIIEFEPQFAVLKDSGNSALLKEQLGDDSNCTILTGSDSISQITKNADYDILISSMVGFAGLSPTIEGIKRG